MKSLFIILSLVFSVSYAESKILSDGHWSNGAPCLLHKNCESGFLRTYSNIAVSDPSGTAVSKEEIKILSPEDWKQAFKAGEISTDPPNVQKFQNQNLVQIFSFVELLKPFKKLGGKFEPNVKPAINEFLKKTSENPVIFYAINGDEMMILVGSSNGKFVGYTTDHFKKRK